MAVFFQPACHGIVGHADRCFVFFFNDTATTEIYTIAYTLSLHDALPISELGERPGLARIEPMTSHCRVHQVSEVPDPYYGGEQGFEDVLDLLEDACGGLLETLLRSP